MRDRPTLRIPSACSRCCSPLGLYALGVAWLSQWIERLPVLLQAVVYMVLGLAWLLPLRRFLIWMETGRWG